jgi:hypothetical protein
MSFLDKMEGLESKKTYIKVLFTRNVGNDLSICLYEFKVLKLK